MLVPPRRGRRFIAELERSFGCFIDAVGGNWLELKRIGDIEVWLGATDNLLEVARRRARSTSPTGTRSASSSPTLQSIVAQGVPDEPEQLAVFQELWEQSMAAFQSAAESARSRRASCAGSRRCSKT